MQIKLTLWLSRRRALAASLLAIPELAPRATRSRAQTGQLLIDRVVYEAIVPVMEKNRVPGIAVAVTVQGKRSLFNDGATSTESGRRVAEDTLFEIGSLSKTFTATLAYLAQARGDLALSAMASKYLSALAGSSFDNIGLLELATYTARGLPVQFPDNVVDRDRQRTANGSLANAAYEAARTELTPSPALRISRSTSQRNKDQYRNDNAGTTRP